MLAPHAPADMFSGIGKNGQLVSIARSKGLVMIRMGEQPSSFGEVPLLILDKIWERLNAVMCNNSSVTEIEMLNNPLLVYPNPANEKLTIGRGLKEAIYTITDLPGKLILQSNSNEIDISELSPGIYIVNCKSGGSLRSAKFVKQ